MKRKASIRNYFLSSVDVLLSPTGITSHHVNAVFISVIPYFSGMFQNRKHGAESLVDGVLENGKN